MPRSSAAATFRSAESPGGPARRRTGDSPAPRGGTWLVVALLLMGVAAAAGAIVFHRRTTMRCLEFYGPRAARRITSAATVELVMLRPGSGPRRLAESSRLDVSGAPGLVHLRRGLVEDANFVWPDRPARDGRRGEQRGESSSRPGTAPPRSRPLEAWDVALVFSDPGSGDVTTLVIDLAAADGAVTVVGQPGWITLGRIGRGLDTWIRDTWMRDTSGRDGPRAAPRGTGATDSNGANGG